MQYVFVQVCFLINDYIYEVSVKLVRSLFSISADERGADRTEDRLIDALTPIHTPNLSLGEGCIIISIFIRVTYDTVV